MLRDRHNRSINYLRISITDRCNLRCRYCMPEQGVVKLDHKEILTYEEILKIVRAASSQGITKVRLTGGEPLVRKGLVDFIAELSRLPEKLDLRLTTNGVLLADLAEDLVRAGLQRINVSLDTLDRRTFEVITGRDELNRVWRGIEAALSLGFDRIKINCVPIRGFNDQEIESFVNLTRELPLDVRFIEFMPLGRREWWSPDKLVTSDEIMTRVNKLGALISEIREENEGPAVVYRLAGARGRIGFISPISHLFCDTCNRLRLTADGKLRLCLLSELEVDLRTRLRRGVNQEELEVMIREAVKLKPSSHPLTHETGLIPGRTMNLIGG
ncbi:MAG: GTP 3',8-cyclase MoaA [Thermodesulfobacteriota bacterium]